MAIDETTDDTKPHSKPKAVAPPPAPKAKWPSDQAPRNYSAEERAKIAGLSDRMRPLAEEAADQIAKLCVGRGCYPVIEDGTRTDEKALEIWAKGRKLRGPNRWNPRDWVIIDRAHVSSYAFPGKSAHRAPDGGLTGGDAVDISLKDCATGAWLRGGSRPDPRWELILGEVSRRLGLVWGGKDGGFLLEGGRRFYDGAHLQHPGWRKPGPH